MSKIQNEMLLLKNLETPLESMTDPGGRRWRAPPTGSISFIFAYVFAEKCTHRRLAPPTGRRPPNGKSWIRHWQLTIENAHKIPGLSGLPLSLGGSIVQCHTGVATYQSKDAKTLICSVE